MAQDSIFGRLSDVGPVVHRTPNLLASQSEHGPSVLIGRYFPRMRFPILCHIDESSTELAGRLPSRLSIEVTGLAEPIRHVFLFEQVVSHVGQLFVAQVLTNEVFDAHREGAVQQEAAIGCI